jgi:hypothetical protein
MYRPAGPVVPTAYRVATPPPAVRTAPVVAALSSPYRLTTSDLLYQVEFAPDPFQRENAAQQLGQGSPSDRARVVRVLLDRASKDEAPLVRAACLRSLVSLKVHDAALLRVLRQAQGDGDLRVRLAAGEVEEWVRTTTSAAMASPASRVTAQ